VSGSDNNSVKIKLGNIQQSESLSKFEANVLHFSELSPEYNNDHYIVYKLLIESSDPVWINIQNPKEKMTSIIFFNTWYRSDTFPTNTSLLINGVFKSQESVSRVQYDESTTHNIIFSYKTNNKPGFLIFGPYIKLHEGNYTVHYRLKYNNVTNSDKKIASLDIFSSYTNETPIISHIDEKLDLYASDIPENTYKSINLTINVEKYNENRLFEFRIIQPGNSDLSVENISIEKIL